LQPAILLAAVSNRFAQVQMQRCQFLFNSCLRLFLFIR